MSAAQESRWKDTMEMHSQRSLYEVHGISIRTRTRSFSRWMAGAFAVVLKLKSALEAELRARRAATELASMDDHMLRDIGISRGEIEFMVRRSRPPAQSGGEHSSSRGQWRR